MPTITPAALLAALETARNVRGAATLLGVTRAWVYKAPELKAVVETWQARPRAPRVQLHVALPPETQAALDELAAERAAAAARSKPDLRRTVIALVEEALRGPLPPPEPASGTTRKLDLGPAWPALLAAAGDHDRAIGVLRAILGGAKKSTGHPVRTS